MDFEEYVVNGDDLISEVVNLYPEAEEFLTELGMHCIGCESAQFESVQDACRVHGLDTAKVIAEINRRIMQ